MRYLSQIKMISLLGISVLDWVRTSWLGGRLAKRKTMWDWRWHRERSTDVPRLKRAKLKYNWSERKPLWRGKNKMAEGWYARIIWSSHIYIIANILGYSVIYTPLLFKFRRSTPWRRDMLVVQTKMVDGPETANNSSRATPDTCKLASKHEGDAWGISLGSGKKSRIPDEPSEFHWTKDRKSESAAAHYFWCLADCEFVRTA